MEFNVNENKNKNDSLYNLQWNCRKCKVGLLYSILFWPLIIFIKVCKYNLKKTVFLMALVNVNGKMKSNFEDEVTCLKEI